MQALEAGQLLVATPALTDPHFAATVVLLLDVNAAGPASPSGAVGGALGVVLNRPSVVLVADVLRAWAEVAVEPEVLFSGGPVAADGALALGSLETGTVAPLGFRPLGAGSLGRIGVVDLDTPVELIGDALAALRVFAGYAGWGAGQLEREVDEGSWYVVPATEADVFAAHTGQMWRDVLRRQPGALAWNATRPADVGLN